MIRKAQTNLSQVKFNDSLILGQKMIGTLLNALTVLIGGTIGSLLGNRFPTRVQETVFAALGLFTLAIGISSSLATGNPLIVLGSLLIGAFIGEFLKLDLRLESLGVWLQKRFTKNEEAGAAGRFVQGFVIASLVFCVGPLTIQGAIEDGLLGDYTKLAIKSMLDGFAALAFSATLGPGVLASVIVILGFQGTLSLLAGLGSNFFTDPMIAEMTATGGVVLLAIGLRLLNLKEIRAVNLLPALFVAPAGVALMDLLKITYYPQL